MKKERGITLVSLVVTIIILIILAGVSINLTLGKNGIITIAKQAKENTELAKIEEETALNELYMQIETEGGASGNISYDAIAKLTEFKTAIANYIEEAGGIKPETTSDATTFGESIKGILKEVTKDATATAEDIANGKTAYVNGELIVGTDTQTASWYSEDIGETLNKSYNISTTSKARLIMIVAVTKDASDAYTNLSSSSGWNQFLFYSDGTYCNACTLSRGTLNITVTDTYFVVPNMVSNAYWKARVYYVL